jgi:hypothetical protein
MLEHMPAGSGVGSVDRRAENQGILGQEYLQNIDNTRLDMGDIDLKY